MKYEDLTKQLAFDAKVNISLYSFKEINNLVCMAVEHGLKEGRILAEEDTPVPYTYDLAAAWREKEVKLYIHPYWSSRNDALLVRIAELESALKTQQREL